MKTKYPILLVHGLGFKDFAYFKSFGRIDDKLKEEGFSVYRSKIDCFGTIENNAIQLKEEVLKYLEKEKTQKINIIAHSKGGLDAKHMISFLGMEDKVASLTTLSTPHKGSIVATKILKIPHFLLKFVAFFLNLWCRILGDKHPDSYKVCTELVRIQNLNNENLKFSKEVYCQSFSSTLKNPKDDFVMGIPLMFSHYFEKNNSDGIVSDDSAVFENYKGEAIDESISHTQIVDFMVTTKKKREKIYAFYNSLCEDLMKRGY